MKMTDIEETIQISKNHIDNESKLKHYLSDLIKNVKSNQNLSIDQMTNQLRKKYKVIPSKVELRYIYEKYFYNIELTYDLKKFLIKKAMRSNSGVLVVTVVLKPDIFSCPMKCSYCPTETDLVGNPTQPKSYLSTEPAMLRALQYNFDIKGQVHDRIKSYIKTGNIDVNISRTSKKLEFIVSGGTWESYPYDYREQVMKEIYWACNTFNNPKTIKSIEDEIEINETSEYRVIGLTIETRPDFITKTSIKDYRRWGITRIQIGVQHYDNNILEKINRECYTSDTITAIKLLKQTGFKVVCHLMPDLPNSSPQLDKWMFYQAINNPHLQFDDVKIYPTAVCQSDNPNIIVKSDIADWYKDGKYMPYADKNLDDLIDVLIYYKSNIQPWIRIQRLVRDIPKRSMQAGYERISNLRQILQNKMKKEGIKCYCIRCMEIGDTNKISTSLSTKLVVRKYKASDGLEYFISFETHKQPKIFSFSFWSYLYFLFISSLISVFIYPRKVNRYWSGDLNTYNGLIGFCRLRIDKNAGAGFIREIKDSALIREVHIYGQTLGVGDNGNCSQHKGYGKLLVKTAEDIAKNHRYNRIAVIAGVGTREYYKNKCGYNIDGTYMIKNI
jgi:ELP3 family radical SAM enzyme/protein acetyltransferase